MVVFSNFKAKNQVFRYFSINQIYSKYLIRVFEFLNFLRPFLDIFPHFAIARVRGILHPIYLTSVLSLIYLVVDNEAASRFIGYKQTHRDGRADLLNSYANAIDRLSATERDIVTQTFGVTTHTIATKQFGMSTISTGFTKPKLKKNPSASVIGEQEKINISTEKNDAEKDSVLVCNSSTVDGSEAPSLSVSSAEPSPMQSSYKNLDKVRKMLIDAAKSIPKKPTYDSEELDRNLIACLAVYECRIKQKGIVSLDVFVVLFVTIWTYFTIWTYLPYRPICEHILSHFLIKIYSHKV